MRRPAAALPLALCLLLCACGDGERSRAPAADAPGAGRPPVTIGTEIRPEQALLGQLYRQALQARGFTVALKQNLGSIAVADAALRRREIDLYPASIGRFDARIAGDAGPHRSVTEAFAAGRAHARRRDLALLPLTPFTDATALAVTPAFARAHELRTLADLRTVAGLRLGAAPAFRADGLVRLTRAYGVRGVRFAPLTLGLQYPVLEAGRIDAAAVGAIDGELRERRYVVLGDPAHAFGFQNVTLVVRREVLDAEGPAFARTLDAVNARLTTPAMRELNAAVTLDGRSAAEAARTFLERNDLV